MSTLVIAGLDEKLLGDISRMADHNGVTIDRQAEQLLSDAVRVQDRATLVGRIRAISAMTPKKSLQIDSVELLRESRNR